MVVTELDVFGSLLARCMANLSLRPKFISSQIGHGSRSISRRIGLGHCLCLCHSLESQQLGMSCLRALLSCQSYLEVSLLSNPRSTKMSSSIRSFVRHRWYTSFYDFVGNFRRLSFGFLEVCELFGFRFLVKVVASQLSSTSGSNILSLLNLT